MCIRDRFTPAWASRSMFSAAASELENSTATSVPATFFAASGAPISVVGSVCLLYTSIPLPRDPVLGPGTINIGRIAGGRAPNVVADEARAEIFVRLVGDPEPIRDAMTAAVAGRAELREIGFIPAAQFESFDGLPTTIVSYTSDAPILSPAWGKPFLIGPGSIRVAHTEAERVPKRELQAAVGLYAGLARQLLKDAR